MAAGQFHEPLDIPVADAASAQRLRGFEQVVERAAEAAGRAAQDLQHLRIGYRAGMRRAGAAQRERERVDVAASRAASQPLRVVDAGRHLALPQTLDLV